MPLTADMFLIVCPLALLAGFVDAVAGGGGLISLPAYYLAGCLPARPPAPTSCLPPWARCWRCINMESREK